MFAGESNLCNGPERVFVRIGTKKVDFKSKPAESKARLAILKRLDDTRNFIFPCSQLRVIEHFKSQLLLGNAYPTAMQSDFLEF